MTWPRIMRPVRPSPLLAIETRPMTLRDMQTVIAIENDCFDFPLSQEQFIELNRPPAFFTMVAESRSGVVGYATYQHARDELRLIHMAVDPFVRRRSVGRQIIDRMKYKLANQNREKLTAIVRETDVPAQLFFKSCGFVVVKVLHWRNADTDENEDAYVFEYHRPK